MLVSLSLESLLINPSFYFSLLEKMLLFFKFKLSPANFGNYFGIYSSIWYSFPSKLEPWESLFEIYSELLNICSLVLCTFENFLRSFFRKYLSSFNRGKNSSFGFTTYNLCCLKNSSSSYSI